MIDLGKTSLLSSLLDAAKSEDSENDIQGLLDATSSDSGAPLSARDVVGRIIGQTENEETGPSLLTDDPVTFNKLEKQVQRYIDDSGDADENEKIQALNDLYSDISSLVQDSLNTEQLSDSTIEENSVSHDEASLSASPKTSQTSVLDDNSDADTSQPVVVKSLDLSAAESTSQRLESSALRTSDPNSQTGTGSQVARTSSASSKSSGNSQEIIRGRGFDVALDLIPGMIIEIPVGVTKQEIQIEFTRLKNAVEKLNAIKMSNAG